jgi:hypothetical protein
MTSERLIGIALYLTVFALFLFMVTHEPAKLEMGGLQGNTHSHVSTAARTTH